MPPHYDATGEDYYRGTHGSQHRESGPRTHPGTHDRNDAGFTGSSGFGQRLLSRFFGRVKNKDLALFSWNLQTMVAAGIPLIRSLESIANQTPNEQLRAAIRGVEEKINSGLSFSEALKLYPSVFSPFFTHMVEVGEIGGVLNESLTELAEYYETLIERKSRIVSAVSYPLVLLVGCMGVVLFIMLFLVPRLFKLFENIATEMPPTTVALIKFSGFVRDYGFMLLAAIAGMALVLRFYLKTSGGRLKRDQFLLKIPLAGKLITRIILSRFSHSLSIMLKTGVSIVNALNIVKELVGNLVVVRMIGEIIEGVQEGSQINVEMRKHTLVPDMVIQMIAVGEETGTLEQMLAKVSEYYDREVNRAIANLNRMVEPMLLVVMAVIVGFIAVSVLDPVTDLMTNMGR